MSKNNGYHVNEPAQDDYGKPTGFRLIYKDVFSHDITGAEKPFSRFEAWLWLLFEAWGDQNKPRKKFVDGKLVSIYYGEIVHSERFMATAWGWGRQKVRSFIEMLIGEQMITKKVTQQITRLTICNFYYYQNRQPSKKPNDNPAITQTKTLEQYNTTNTNRVLSEKTDFRTTRGKNYSADFNDFWATLPSQMKTGKKNAYRHWRSSVTTEQDHQDIRTALDNYKQTRRYKQGYIQNGSTWMNNWRDWIDYSEPIGVQQGKTVVEVTPAGWTFYSDGSSEYTGKETN